MRAYLTTQRTKPEGRGKAGVGLRYKYQNKSQVLGHSKHKTRLANHVTRTAKTIRLSLFFCSSRDVLNFCTKTCGKAERRKEEYDSELNIDNRGFNSLIS
jgi:hypothetical protein